MTVYYYNSRDDECVPPQAPRAMSFKQTLRAFRRLYAEGDFLGVNLPENAFFQMRREDGAWWAELINATTLLGHGCKISDSMAEQALGALFEGKDVKAWLSEHYAWLHWAIVQL